MQCNVGKRERIVRTVIGLAVLGIGLILQTWWGLLGFIPILTAVLGWCPVSALLGVSTCKDKESTFQDTSTYTSPRPMRTREMDNSRKRHPSKPRKKDRA